MEGNYSEEMQNIECKLKTFCSYLALTLNNDKCPDLVPYMALMDFEFN